MNNTLNNIAICDGSCLSNPGSGGWCYIFIQNNQKIVKAGYSAYSTNNIMELTALLYCIKEVRPATMYTDSMYVVNGFNIWMHNWNKKHWKTADKKDVKNIALWQEILEFYSDQFELKWIKGHAQIRSDDPMQKLYQLQHEVDNMAKFASINQVNISESHRFI